MKRSKPSSSTGSGDAKRQCSVVDPPLVYPPDSGGEVSEPASDVAAGTSKMNDSHLSGVLEEVHDAHSKWYGIGLRLGLVPTVLKGIEKEYSNTKEMLREMLGYWLKQVTPVPTWVALIEALKSKTVNEPSLAEQLEEHHISPPPDGLLSPDSVSNITNRHKQFLGLKNQLQVTTKEVESQIENYQSVLQQNEKTDPSDEVPVAVLERQPSQDDGGGLRTKSERAVHIQLRELKNRMLSLEERVQDETVIKELDQDEMDCLLTRNSELVEELHYIQDKLAELVAKNAELEKKNADFEKKNGELEEKSTELDKNNTELEEKNTELEEKNASLTTEKEALKHEKLSLMDRSVEKDKEIASKAKDLAEKAEDYKSLLEEKQRLENEVQKQAEELQQLQKFQGSDEMPALPETSDGTETAAETSTVEQ